MADESDDDSVLAGVMARVGHYGLFQKLCLIGAALSLCLSGMNVVVPVFIAYEPRHR